MFHCHKVSGCTPFQVPNPNQMLTWWNICHHVSFYISIDFHWYSHVESSNFAISQWYIPAHLQRQSHQVPVVYAHRGRPKHGGTVGSSGCHSSWLKATSKKWALRGLIPRGSKLPAKNGLFGVSFHNLSLKSCSNDNNNNNCMAIP